MWNCGSYQMEYLLKNVTVLYSKSQYKLHETHRKVKFSFQHLLLRYNSFLHLSESSIFYETFFFHFFQNFQTNAPDISFLILRNSTSAI